MIAQANTNALTVRALDGAHELVVKTALRYFSRAGTSALDLGAGSGALAKQLREAGFVVSAVDIGSEFCLDVPFLQLDLNDPFFHRALSNQFNLITSVEVIEHLENPTAFLRSIRQLLAPGGAAIITTPNVENVAARLKFLASGRVRAMDHNSPEHVTPIYLDILKRKILPSSGLQLVEHFVYPVNDFPLTGRRIFVPIFQMIAPLLKGPALTGDTHMFVLASVTDGMARRP